jgi:hypothetical protein
MYEFRIGVMGGSLGWVRWRNTIPESVSLKRMRCFGTFWGTMCWGGPVSEEAFQQLVEISEEMGLYGERFSNRVEQPTQDLEHRDSGSLERQNS